MEEALCISNAWLEDIDLIGCLSAQTQQIKNTWIKESALGRAIEISMA